MCVSAKHFQAMNSLGAGVGEFRREVSREDIATLLVVARRNLNEGNPGGALQAVVAALRSVGGEQAVTTALRRAREVYENNVRINEATDELTTLFAQCAIATLPPNRTSDAPEPMAVETTLQERIMLSSFDVVRSSILAESGREQVVYDASADGSSFLCQQCGGVVSNSRRDEHLSYWCSTAFRN
ncbi:uncharacterized protein [Physcomitrium patens]|uniref:C2HC zinc finger plants domain-containing protein n=1 Tax=Physcomitrium patens TaxID=3218 RepID=A0A2K1JGF1_PHYPA|nr:uncharacterized protein LOC112291153 [Physcomitrium patens]XP_024393989.1 uncharacterized protein LOC112291153 [Physcomitrium patens]XP_024393990.1 uncharacterized protein LOC112291153 [Physcomitrium patens]XP_024393991.1 uncharacterized protein LOC112291153 [Physcomitrium patens]XP_024393992.1 uncharacterized protein LOC112291153 [Physcomitrium patens]XP_024393994.1 uncharacterized protein LOC112291153 [Physcomitrium patens]XP_024393995.1 uncharacterized protein LOC112291155 [Physcomitriu|eukprot:XP_024393988.1 uncharacterized protein LOC112291153 [Physcomitrella patens]